MTVEKVEKMIEVIERIKADANRLDVGINAEGLSWTDLEKQALQALYKGGSYYSNLYDHVYNKMDEIPYFSNGTFLDALDDVLDALRNVVTA